MTTPHDDDAPPATLDNAIAQEELDLVERLDREATPGPWEFTTLPHDERRGTNDVCDMVNDCFVMCFGDLRRYEDDGRFIAAARTLLPRLARALRSAEDRAAKAEARGRHAHDAANRLYQAVNVAIASLEPYGARDLYFITKSKIEILRAAIDPAEQAAALAEVQRRDRLESDLAAARAALDLATAELGALHASGVKAVEDAYARGRREAIEEAQAHLKFLRDARAGNGQVESVSEMYGIAAYEIGKVLEPAIRIEGEGR